MINDLHEKKRLLSFIIVSTLLAAAFVGAVLIGILVGQRYL